LAIVNRFFLILCLMGLSGLMASGAPKEELNQELRLRLIAESQDLAKLNRFAQECHKELAYYFPGTAAIADAPILTICYDVEPPKAFAHPVMLSSACSREEQAYRIFKAFLQRDFVDPRQPPLASRLGDLDWLVAGLTFSCLHGSSMAGERVLPDARPVLGFYLGLAPFSLAEWISEPIPPSPSLAYQLYGLNSLHLIALFNRQPNASIQAWLTLWGRGSPVEEAACQVLTPRGKPQDLDAWITRTMTGMLKDSMVLTAEDLQMQTALLDTWPVAKEGTVRPLALVDAAKEVGWETVGGRRFEDYLWLVNHALTFLKPAMRELTDGATQLQKGNGWRSQRAFASGQKELEKQLAYSRQVQRYLDRIEIRESPLREMAPTLFLIEDKARIDELQHSPTMHYWLERLDARPATP
jgi:hypothetical protein